MTEERDLLAGVLAGRMELVTSERLLAALDAWAIDRRTPLLDVLRKQGALNPDDAAAVEHAVARQLARHGNDPARALAGFRLDGPLARWLAGSDHPEVRGLLPTLDVRGPTAAPRAPAPTGPTRYRRLRGHARGGLGEVSVALDEELRREVALKEIQAHLADSPEVRARFVREAEITGQLEHPGIVPVYGLGVADGGRPYYAMRFVGGDTLQAAIERHHAGAGYDRRGLLTRFVAVCNAVAYAHRRGVVHRDLKPANVILGEFGEALVVDWGLARRADEPPSAVLPAPGSGGGTLTVEGQAVGTPAFMPPEQASGRLGDVGPHSDVFALGATLYAILTGQPPYPGPNALDDAARCEPVPARRVRRGVPAALDAVCRKAMAKDPRGRYASARELAADVERWLADEPVSAYRDPLSVRALRWARKRRTLVASLAALLVAGVVALGVGLFVVRREQDRTSEALARARHNLEQAEANLSLARKAVDECFNVAQSDPLFQSGGMLPAKRLLLARALPFYRDFQARGGAELDRDEAEGLFRVGYITKALGQPAEAMEAYGRAGEIRERLAAANPDAADDQNVLALTLTNTANVLQDLHRQADALPLLRRAGEIRRKLVKDHPGTARYRGDLASTLVNTGNILRDLNRREDALKALEEAAKTFEGVDDPAFRDGLAGTLVNAGLVLGELGRPGDALKVLARAEGLFRQLVGAHPHVPGYRDGLAVSLTNSASLLQGQLKRPEALKAFRQAVEERQKLADAHPAVAAYGSGLAGLHAATGNLLLAMEKYDDALQSYARAVAAYEALVAADGKSAAHRSGLAGTLNNQALLLQGLGKLDDALVAYRKAEAAYRKLSEDDASVAAFRDGLATTLLNTANLLQGKGDREEALKLYAQAERIFGELADANPGVPAYRASEALTRTNAGVVLSHLRRWDDALDAHRRAEAASRRLVKDHPKVLEYRRGLGDALTNAALVLRERGRRDPAVAALEEALTLYVRLHAEDEGDPSHRMAIGRTQFHLAEVWAEEASLSDGREADKHAAEALRRLGEAKKYGYLDTPVGRAGLRSRAFRGIRERAEFKAFVASRPG